MFIIRFPGFSCFEDSEHEFDRFCNQETGKRRNLAIGKRTLSFIKSHGMINRKDRINEENIPGSIGYMESIKISGRGRWNLEEEVAKVIEKGCCFRHHT